MKEKKRVEIGWKIIAGIIGVACIGFICLHAWQVITTPKSGEQEDHSIEEKSDDIWLEQKPLDSNENITLSLKEAVLGKAEQQKKLQVFTQEVSDVTKITDEGWGFFKWGRKYQYVKYSGTATYTVDLSNMDENHLVINPDDRTLTILIPHVVEKLDINENETQADDTENVGIFSIGDLKLSEEERKEVISRVKATMEQKLKDEKSSENADRMAKLSVWEIYQPVVSKVSPDYTVVVEFEEK